MGHSESESVGGGTDWTRLNLGQRHRSQATRGAGPRSGSPAIRVGRPGDRPAPTVHGLGGAGPSRGSPPTVCCRSSESNCWTGVLLTGRPGHGAGVGGASSAIWRRKTVHPVHPGAGPRPTTAIRTQAGHPCAAGRCRRSCPELAAAGPGRLRVGVQPVGAASRRRAEASRRPLTVSE